MTSLISDLTLLKADLTGILIDLGLPQYQQHVHIRKAYILPRRGLTPTIEYLAIEPNPRIEDLPPRLVGVPLSQGSLILGEDDLLLRIPRTYSENQLRDNVDHYIIGGTAPKFLDGQRCKLLDIRHGKALTWEVLLRKFRDGESDASAGGLREPIALSATITATSNVSLNPAVSYLWDNAIADESGDPLTTEAGQNLVIEN